MSFVSHAAVHTRHEPKHFDKAAAAQQYRYKVRTTSITDAPQRASFGNLAVGLRGRGKSSAGEGGERGYSYVVRVP